MAGFCRDESPSSDKRRSGLLTRRVISEAKGKFCSVSGSTVTRMCARNGALTVGRDARSGVVATERAAAATRLDEWCALRRAWRQKGEALCVGKRHLICSGRDGGAENCGAKRIKFHEFCS